MLPSSHNVPAILLDLVLTFGRDVTQDPTKLRGLLADLFAGQREIAELLALAGTCGVARELAALNLKALGDLDQEELVRRVEAEGDLAGNQAEWVVGCWVAALSSEHKPTGQEATAAGVPTLHQMHPDAPKQGLSVEYLLKRGRGLEHRGEREEAVALYELALQLAPTNPRARTLFKSARRVLKKNSGPSRRKGPDGGLPSGRSPRARRDGPRGPVKPAKSEPARDGALAKLRLIAGGPEAALGQAFSILGTTTVIGRDEQRCDILIPDPRASGVHATIHLEDAGFTLHDLESKNGTYHNHRRVTMSPLTSGDKIRIGYMVFIFSDER